MEQEVQIELLRVAKRGEGVTTGDLRGLKF